MIALRIGKIFSDGNFLTNIKKSDRENGKIPNEVFVYVGGRLNYPSSF